MLRAMCAPIVSKPDVEALLDENERQTALRVCQANPNLAIHQKTMMQIYDWLSSAVTGVGILLALFGGQAVEPQEIAILRQNNMLFVGIAMDGAELFKVPRIEYRIHRLLFVVLL